MRAEEILAYWFGGADRTDPSADDLKARITLWFESGSELDAEVTRRFAGDLERAVRGEYDDWEDNARDMLALIVILDQFPRNIHRGSPLAFSYDARSLALTQAAIARGFEASYSPVHRVVLYLPLMHSEDLEVQRVALASYKKLFDDSSEALRAQMVNVLRAAERHFEIIERFGRYPHRNKTVGREMTPTEVAFLTEPKSSF
ncbi:MAG: DUF924 family protein [Polyangiaceae bacterium]